MIAILLLLALLASMIWVYLDRMGALRSVWIITFAGFAARIAFVLVDSFVELFGLFDDAVLYERTLWFVAQQWQTGVLFAPFQVSSGPGHGGHFEILFSAVLSPVYFLFGRSPILVRLTMAFVGVLVVVNVFLIGRELLDDRAGVWAASIAAFFPYWIYLSGILYRDTLVVLFYTWMIYFLLRWEKKGSRLALTLCLLATTLGLSLRLQNIPIVLALFGMVVFVQYDPNIGEMVASGVAFLGALFVFLNRWGDHVSVEGLAAQRRILAREKPGSYLTAFGYESLPELVAFAPIGMLYFVLVPFPWQAVDGLVVVAILQNVLIWYPVILFAILGVRDSMTIRGSRATVPLVTFVLAGFFIYGLVEGNIGPAMRHRSQFQFILFALAGVALSRRVRLKILSETHNAEPTDRGQTVESNPTAVK